jgi:hypothetical protein
MMMLSVNFGGSLEKESNKISRLATYIYGLKNSEEQLEKMVKRIENQKRLLPMSDDVK